jgi:hypothetical protein
MGRPSTGDDFERFWRRTSIGSTGCIEIVGWHDKDGYGRAYARRPGGGYHTFIAHRWIYSKCVGPIPEGLVVMHSCDNPSCVTLQHLSIGTQRDNQQDAVRKGRHSAKPGEAHRAAKLTLAQVEEIRASQEPGVSLASRFNVSPSAVWRVRHNKSWKHR